MSEERYNMLMAVRITIYSNLFSSSSKPFNDLCENTFVP